MQPTGIVESLTWAPRFPAPEMVPFLVFPRKNALHPQSVCVHQLQMRCDLLHHSCMQWQAAVYFKNNIRNLEQNGFNDDLSLRAFATGLAVFLPPNFCGACSAVSTFSAQFNTNPQSS